MEPGRSRMTKWRMRFACLMPKATGTHSEYVTIIALSLQKWLHQRASLLRYKYTDCIVVNSPVFCLPIVEGSRWIFFLNLCAIALRYELSVITLYVLLVNIKFNPLQMTRRLLYLKTQSVPSCKHFTSRL